MEATRFPQFIPYSAFDHLADHILRENGVIYGMERGKMPIKYGYAILIGLSLGLILGAKTYLPYLFWEETHLYDWEKHFLPHFLNNTLWGILVPLVYFTFRKFPVGRSGNSGTRVRALLASVGVGAIHEAASWGLYAILMGIINQPLEENLMQIILGWFPSAVISRMVEFWIIYIIFASLAYSKELHDNQVQLARTESQLYNAKLTTLKRQMQPHFLFNTLNTISSLMEVSIQDAQSMVSKLGILLRRALNKNQRHWVSLREEVDFVRTYLDIEQTRFNDRLHIDYEIDPAVLETSVPALILQPLVENAIKHGFSNSSGDCRIRLRAWEAEPHFIELEVSDDGQGSPLPHSQILEKGIGLRNVRNRLELMYPGSYEMQLETSPGHGFAVRLRLPVDSENNDNGRKIKVYA